MSTLRVDTIANTAGVPAKRLLQNLQVTTGALATGTTTIPFDNTIPQITEGDQYMSLAITPTTATSILEILVITNFLNNTSVHFCTALFRDAVADALATGYSLGPANNTVHGGTKMLHRMVSGTVSEIVFKVRAGANSASTTTFNGYAGARYGGTLASSITIKEYAA
jgi:hypothetical protein